MFALVKLNGGDLKMFLFLICVVALSYIQRCGCCIKQKARKPTTLKEADKWNSTVSQSLIYTCVFPAVHVKITSVKKIFTEAKSHPMGSYFRENMYSSQR